MDKLLLVRVLCAVLVAGAGGILYGLHDALRVRLNEATGTTANLDHRPRAWVRLLALLLLAVAVDGLGWPAVLTAAVCACAFGISFDPAINFGRGLGLDYIGVSDWYGRQLTRLFGSRAGEVSLLGEWLLLCGLLVLRMR